MFIYCVLHSKVHCHLKPVHLQHSHPILQALTLGMASVVWWPPFWTVVDEDGQDWSILHVVSLSNPTYLGLIPMNRVNNAISNTNRLTYKCHTFLETSGQDLPIWPHKGLIKGGNFNPTPIDRVNKSISNNIRLTYKCHTLFETSGHGLPIYQHIRLILGGYLTPHTYRVNKFMTNNLL